MKNIHLLLTNKPSSLGYDGNKTLHLTNMFIDDYVNIYITSDEEIRVNDYITDGYKVWKWKDDSSLLGRKKIILTTDQDLIKDGVQAINDKFLEWFVKNPSYEYIEIENVYDKFLNSDKRSVSDFRKKYKITIPKEEPKQCELCKRYPILEGTNKCESCYSVVRHVLEQNPKFKDTLLPDLRKKQETLTNNTDSHSLDFENFKVIKTEEDAKIFVETMENIPEPNDKLKKAFKNFNKQETLEEAAANYANKELNSEFTSKVGNFYGFSSSFIEGAKWQAENMYSEEDMKQFGLYLGDNLKKSKGKTIDEIFEQFKKE